MSVKLQPTKAIIKDLGLDKDGLVTRFLATTCRKHMDKYVPYDEGTLAGEAYSTKNQIIYDQEYATYIYEGISKSGKKLNYHLDKHPYATSYWDKKMWSAEREQVISKVENYMKRIGG